MAKNFNIKGNETVTPAIQKVIDKISIATSKTLEFDRALKELTKSGHIYAQQLKLNATDGSKVIANVERSNKEYEIMRLRVINAANAMDKLTAAQRRQDLVQVQAAINMNRAQRQLGLQQIRASFVGPSGIDYGPRPLTGTAEAQAWNINRQMNLGLMDRQMNKVAGSTKAFNLSLRQAIQGLEYILLYQGFAVLEQQLSQAVQTSIQLSKQIGLIQTISQDAQLPIEQWNAGIRKVSNTFGTDVLDTARATYEAISNQAAKGAEAFDLMQSVGKLALTTGSTQMEAMQGITGVMKAYGLTVQDAERISATFFKSVDLGRVKMSEMGETIGTVLGPAAALGVSFEEISGTLDLLTIRGIAPAVAMTELRQMMNAMIKPSKEMKEALKDTFGVETGQAAIATHGWVEVLRRLEERSADSTTEIGKLFLNLRALVPALILNKAGTEELANTIDQLKKSTEDYNKASSIMMNNAGVQAEIAVTKWKNWWSELTDTSALYWAKMFGMINTEKMAIERAWEDRKIFIRSANNEIKDDITNQIKSVTQEYLRQNADLNRVTHEQLTNMKETYVSIETAMGDIIERTTKKLKDQSQELEHAATTAEHNAKNIRAWAVDELRKGEKLFFDWDLDRKTTPQKVATLLQQIKHLEESSKQLIGTGSIDQFKKERGEIIDLYKEIYKIQEKGEQDITKLIKEKSDLEIRRKELLQKKPTLENKDNIIENKQKLDEVNAKLKEALTLHNQQIDVRTKLNAAFKETERLADEFAKAELKRQDSLLKQKMIQDAQLQQWNNLLAEEKKFKIEKVLQLDSEQEINKAITRRAEVIANINKMQSAAGFTPEERIIATGISAFEQQMIDKRLQELKVNQMNLQITKAREEAEKEIAKAIEDRTKAQIAAERPIAEIKEILPSLQGKFTGSTFGKTYQEVITLAKQVMAESNPEKLNQLLTQMFSKKQQIISENAGGLGEQTADQINKIILRTQDLIKINSQVIPQDQITKWNNQINNLHVAFDKINSVAPETVSAFDRITNAINKMVDSLEQRSGTTKNIQPTYSDTELINQATGGRIHGTDTVPAMLSPGEFVVNAGAARRFHSQLVSMNSWPRFADGGRVDVGGVNLSLNSVSPSYDAKALVNGIRREIRRGTLRMR